MAAVGPRLNALWRQQRQAFAVITDQELAAGVAHLSEFRAVYPLDGGNDAYLQAYIHQGGHVVRSPGELEAYAPAYAALTPDAPAVEVVPSVDSAHRTAWLTVSSTSATGTYRGSLTIDLAGLGLPAGRYRVVDVTTGRPVPIQTGKGGLTASLTVTPGSLALWQVVPVR